MTDIAPLRILLVDNNEVDVKVVSKLLTSHYDRKYKLITKTTTSDCIATLENEDIDILLIDLFLPDSNVEDTLNLIERYEEDYPIIILSTIEDKESRIKAIKKGAQDYLVKNQFDGRLLKRIINYSLERHKLHHELHGYAKRLKHEETKLIESQAIALIGNWELNIATLEFKCSSVAAKILEFGETVITVPLDQLIALVHDRQKKPLKDIILKSVTDDSEYNEDIRLLFPGKRRKHINLRLRTSRYEDGKQVVRGTIQNITDRKEIEYQLKASEEKYHRLFTESRDAIYITSEQGEFIDFNNATLELFGYTDDDMRKIQVSKLYFNPYERERAKKEITKKGFVRDFELALKKQDGTKIDCVITSTLWKSNDGRKKGYQGIIRDITEQKSTEELIRNKEIAERSSRLKQRFLANMSHEIRTPINAIAGLTYLLRKTELTQDQQEYVDGISTSSDHLKALVNDILDYSKIEEGKITFEAVEFDLGEQLRQLINSLEHTAEAKGVELRLKIDQKIPTSVVGDPVRLNQIIINLLSNAIKFTQEGWIELSVYLLEDSDDAVVLNFAVADTGSGIPDNKLKTIFRSFTQLGRNLTEMAEGTGLGLAITKQLVQMQGGTINVTSRLNEGSTFEVTMMFKKFKQEGQESREDQENFNIQNIGHKKFLIVDDKKLNQLVTSEMIKNWWQDAEVEVANNGKEAVEKVIDGEFDLVMMDVQMPVMDGYEATELLRYQQKLSANKLPIIAMTAYNTEAEADKCLEAGMNDYIAKPFKPVDLYNKVINWISYHNGEIKQKLVTSKPEETKSTYQSDLKPYQEDLDLSYLDSITGGNDDLKQQIIQLLIEETPDEMERLEQFTKEQNWKRVRAVSHKMKSGISYMGLTKTLELAKEIEEYAENEHHLEKIPLMVKQVNTVCSKALTSLKAMDFEFI